MSALTGRHAVVVGAGVAGRAAAETLAAEGARVVLTERRDADSVGDVSVLEAARGDGAHRRPRTLAPGRRRR